MSYYVYSTYLLQLTCYATKLSPNDLEKRSESAKTAGTNGADSDLSQARLGWAALLCSAWSGGLFSPLFCLSAARTNEHSLKCHRTLEKMLCKVEFVD